MPGPWLVVEQPTQIRADYTVFTGRSGNALAHVVLRSWLLQVAPPAKLEKKSKKRAAKKKGKAKP